MRRKRRKLARAVRREPPLGSPPGRALAVAVREPGILEHFEPPTDLRSRYVPAVALVDVRPREPRTAGLTQLPEQFISSVVPGGVPEDEPGRGLAVAPDRERGLKVRPADDSLAVEQGIQQREAQHLRLRARRDRAEQAGVFERRLLPVEVVPKRPGSLVAAHLPDLPRALDALPQPRSQAFEVAV